MPDDTTQLQDDQQQPPQVGAPEVSAPAWQQLVQQINPQGLASPPPGTPASPAIESARKRLEALDGSFKQLSQLVAQEMQPGSLQRYTGGPPTAGSLLHDMLYDFTRANMSRVSGWGPTEPIAQTRLRNAFAFQQQRMKGLSDLIGVNRTEAQNALGELRAAQQNDWWQGRLQELNQANTIREQANEIRSHSQLADFPTDIVDFYQNLPADFLKSYPVKPPTVPEDGQITVAELRALNQRYLRDASSLMAWQTKNESKTMNAVALAIKSAGGDPTSPDSVTEEIAKKAMGLLKPQMPGVQLTPNAIQMAARLYASTGQMPSLGMGASGAIARGQVMNAAGELGTSADPVDIAANKAIYGADAGALKRLQTTRDTLVAYEGTANANLDNFIGLAKKVVDSGSPWVNKPLRSVDRQGLGAADVAAFDAARQVALREIANVTNNPNLIGVLSDNARRDVLDLLPESATLQQILDVSKVLRSDMTNRQKYLDGAISDAQQRMRARTSQPGKTNPSPIAPPVPAGNATERRIQVRRKSDGRTGTLSESQFDATKYDRLP